MRSKMCESGRKLRQTSLPAKGICTADVITFEYRLSCVSMTPFGSPVVPDV